MSGGLTDPNCFKAPKLLRVLDEQGKYREQGLPFCWRIRHAQVSKDREARACVVRPRGTRDGNKDGGYISGTDPRSVISAPSYGILLCMTQSLHDPLGVPFVCPVQNEQPFEIPSNQASFPSQQV